MTETDRMNSAEVERGKDDAPPFGQEPNGYVAPGHEVAVVPKSKALQTSPMSTLMPRDLSSIDTSLDLTTLNGKLQLANSMGPQPLNTYTDHDIHTIMVGYVCYRDTETDGESGEIRECVRSIILAADGKHVATTGLYIPARIKALESMIGRDGIRSGVPVHIKKTKGRRQRDYVDMRVETEAT